MNFDLLPGWIVSTDYPIKLHLDHIFSCVHVMTYTSNYISLELHSKYIWLKKPCPLNLNRHNFPKETWSFSLWREPPRCQDVREKLFFNYSIKSGLDTLLPLTFGDKNGSLIDDPRVPLLFPWPWGQGPMTLTCHFTRRHCDSSDTQGLRSGLFLRLTIPSF